ncbi:MAG: redox-regulated ATPase YchF [Bacillota bacterium]|nr:redox-regulated ATPase YchF [Bacillota bacterium]
MAYSCGLVGLPNAGKSTLFRALTGVPAEVGNYPFTTVAPQRGQVPVEDERLSGVARVMGSARITPAVVEVVDVAGLVEGASQGQGLGNRFLAQIREVDALFHVVRCFGDPGVVHVTGEVSPARDAELVDTELMLADLETLGRYETRLSALIKTGEPRWKEEAGRARLLRESLGKGVPARLVADEGARTLAASLNLLTVKPVLYVANVGEGDDIPADLAQYASRQQAPVYAFAARLEAELGEMDAVERAALLEDLGWPGDARQGLVRAGAELLGLITFFTANENECRARAVPRGTAAVEAAARVHTDMARGFIRAEVVPAADLLAAGSYQAARERGLVRTEGRDYRVQDGDVLLFRFQR